ncbi:MAG: patatin family protein [Lachnospiraceae bacterium]|nr:patatin family protein [Lachnospiraceae bacterium]
MIQAGLVLEGGGMRGIYTAGVLDFFLDQNMIFSSIYGVSAGACHMCSYMSGQRRRAYRIGVNYLDLDSYCSVKNLLLTGDLFNVKTCYDLIPNHLDPFDYEAAEQYPGKAYAVVTNIKTGKAEYIHLKDMHKDMDAVRASASLPLVSRSVKIGDSYYLDGGLADMVPLHKSILDGNQKNVVILTKEVGYVRKPTDQAQLALAKIRYVNSPAVYQDLKRRHIVYAETLDYMERLEEEGKVFVLRPQVDLGVGRIEKSKEKLEKLYQQGYQEAKQNADRLKAFLEK